MASNVPLTGGYDYKFVDTPPEKLVCQICLLVARTPHQVMCCGKVYCKACLDEHKRHSNTCPNCRKTRQNFPDVRGEQEIKALKVKCNNVENGCGWIGELQSLDNHLTTCGYALLQCTNKCTKAGFFSEEVYVLRRDMDNHLKNMCPNRQYQCPHCKDTGRHWEITTTHLDTCPKLKIPCPNAQCNASVPRCELADHRTKCLFEEVCCKYAEIGCKEKPLRKDLRQHENDYMLHLQLAVETVNQQQKEIKTMKEEQEAMKEEQEAMKEEQEAMKEEQEAMKEEQEAMKEEQEAMKEEQEAMKEEQEAMKEEQRAMKEEQEVMEDVIAHTQPSPCVFKMPKFNQYKKSQDEWYSPPFYIHPGSYKMCIRVDANGNGSGKGTHISVFAYLMRGKNDDNLSWPFTGKVTITLLNQLEDKNHHTKAVMFPEEVNTEINVRVVNSDRGHSGYGLHFISHNQLGYDAEQNCQYLKDDCLYFRVAVETSDPLKPWLTCTI